MMPFYEFDMLCNKIVKRFHDGDSIEDIATEVGMTPKEVHDRLAKEGHIAGKEGGAPLQVVWKRTTPELRAQVIELYRSGKLIRAVAQVVGVSFGRVHRILDRAGVLRGREEARALLAQQRQASSARSTTPAGASGVLVGGGATAIRDSRRGAVEGRHV